MFDTFAANRFATLDNNDAETGSSGGGGRFVEGFEPATNPSFGAIASYQICGCCGVYRGPTDGTDGGGQGVILNGDDRGGFGSNGKPSLFTDDAGAQITRTGQSWATALGTAAVVTYAFRASAVTMPTDTQGFSQFSASQIAATIQALAAWSDVANITFNRVNDAGSEYSNSATILLGNYSSGQSGAAAFAYLPGGRPGATANTAVQGDVWINSSLNYNAAPVQQGYGQLTLLHEIGHAIGLSHPAAYNASAGTQITYGANAIYFEDSLQYSVMSYFTERDTGANYRVNGVGTTRYASIPQLDDISAAQRLYGANMATRTSDTTYGFNSNAGQVWFSASSATSALIFAVWDAGGVDTFDFSGYTSSSTIDLRQAAFSSVGGMVGNVSIALGAVIENAIGGTGADTIRGNSADNRITGGGGNDLIDGGLGSDTVVFSGARASYTITWNGQVGTVTGPGGTVTVRNVESLAFSDQTIAATPTGGLIVAGDITNETITGSALADMIGGLGGNDTINGLDGNDALDGGSGTDTLNGGNGDDVLVGGLGNDVLNGGAGVDTADYSGASSGVTVDLAAGTSTGGGGSDTYVSVEAVTGSAMADTITGDANANILRGGGGIDTLNGGGGDDQLFAGAPGLSSTAADVIKSAGTANATIASAVALNGAFDLLANDNIVNSTTIPHATVVASTHGGVEYYAITVIAGDTVSFDIDGASFDSTLRLFDASGVEITSNDDSDTDSGSSGFDAGLSYTFGVAGTYYIQVAEWAANGGGTFTSKPPAAGGTYTLHVSVPSATTAPTLAVGSTLNGDAGTDTLTGGVGADKLNGGADNDILIGGLGDDTLDGGTGTDTAVFTGNRADYTISTTSGVTTITGADGADKLTNVERLQFSNGVFDINGAPVTGGPINGTSGNDTLQGTSEPDVINGGAGDDIITGGSGNDIIDGGVGTDTSVFSGTIAETTVTTSNGIITVVGPDGTDTLTNVEYLRFSDGTLIVGAGGGQLFTGTAGNDTLVGTAFADDILGGAGDDVLIGAIGADALNGGEGVDTADYSSSSGRVDISLTRGTGYGGDANGDTLSGIENLIGTNAIYTDFLTGDGNNNTISGLAGDDELRGAGGNDTLFGGAGNDLLDGGAGNDTLIGGVGADALTGGDGVDTADYSSSSGRVDISLTRGMGYGSDAGGDTLSGIENLIGTNAIYTDFLTGNASDNTLSGLAGDDELRGLAGNDTLLGGAGDDLLEGGTGADILDGGDGSDTADYSASSGRVDISLTRGMGYGGDAGGDTLSGIENLIGTNAIYTDFLTGNASDNTLSGLAGDDELRGLAGNDTLLGGAGDDLLEGGTGADILDGGGGIDTADYSASSGRVDISLTRGMGYGGDASGDTLFGVENLIGTNAIYTDFLTGNASDNTLSGLAGDDELRGLVGNDTLLGGTGADILDGGEGDDFLIGGAGADTFIGGAGSDTVDYSLSADRIDASLTRGMVYGGVDASGDTLFGIENLIGTNSIYTDFLTGNASDNRLSGLAGDDELRGLAGNDTLIGGTGADILDGGDGVDTADYSASSGRVDISLTRGMGYGGDAGGDTLSGIENLIGTNAIYTDFLTGNASDNTLSGLAGDDELRGLAGNDTLIGGTGNDALYGGEGTDTAVYSGNRAAYTISVMNGVTTVSGPDGVDTLFSVEQLQFADFITDAWGEPLVPSGALNDLAKDFGPLVMPLASEGTVKNAGPQILPVAPDDTVKEVIPQVQPAVFDDSVKEAGPLVLPVAPHDIAKEGTPLTLPGETDVFMGLGRNQLTWSDVIARHGDIAAVLSMFGEVAGEDHHLPVAEVSGSPEDLTAMADDFVPTGTFEDHLVMPLASEETVKNAGPQILPVAPDDAVKEVIPQVQPAVFDDSVKEVGPLVLPVAPHDIAKEGTPLTLPVETDVFMGLGRSQLTESDVIARHGDSAAVLSMFGEVAGEDHHLSVAEVSGSPEDLTALADDFVPTGASEDHLVMPPLDGDFDAFHSVRNMDAARVLLSLAGEHVVVPLDGNSLLGDLNLASPGRTDDWN